MTHPANGSVFKTGYVDDDVYDDDDDDFYDDNNNLPRRSHRRMSLSHTQRGTSSLLSSKFFLTLLNYQKLKRGTSSLLSSKSPNSNNFLNYQKNYLISK